MAQMIKIVNDLLRISPADPRKIEISFTNGLSWTVRYHGGFNVGSFMDLEADGKNIIGYTDKGVFVSKPGYTMFMRK